MFIAYLRPMVFIYILYCYHTLLITDNIVGNETHTATGQSMAYKVLGMLTMGSISWHKAKY